MQELFLTLLNMSITASYLTLAVILLRLVLKNAPKIISVALWGLVAFRLVCPISIESVLSLLPSKEVIPPDIMYMDEPYIHSGIPSFNMAVNPILSQSVSDSSLELNPINVITFTATILWIIGIFAMLVYALVSYLRVYLRVREAACLEENIWVCDKISTPFIFGIIRPKIYLPSVIKKEDAGYVIAHERAHLKRFDHLIKPFAFLLLTIYWFNPVMWIAYILLCRDIELACDEKVIKEQGEEIKKPYSEALINCSVPKKVISACPLAFGETFVKGRIKKVLNYKKHAFWVIIVSLILCLAVTIGFLTNPKTEKTEAGKYGISCNSVGAECDDVVYEYIYGSIDFERPYISVKWTNNTDKELRYGPEFILYKDGKVYEPEEVMAWNTILYALKSGKSDGENYDLSLYNLVDGNYTLEKSFYFGDDVSKKYRAFVNFSISRTYSFLGTVYEGEEKVYEDLMYSSVFYETPESIPKFMVSDRNFHLYISENQSSLTDLGLLKKVELTSKNFEEMLSSREFESYHFLKKLRKNNLNALFLGDYDKDRIYYFLEQKNGDIYIATGSSTIPNIRYVFKMKKGSQHLNPEIQNIAYYEGSVMFYSEQTVEDEIPFIEKYAHFNASYGTFLKLLSSQKWVYDAIVDRTEFYYDGKIFCNQNWLYFGYQQKVIYYNGYFCNVDDEILEFIKNQEQYAAKLTLPDDVTYSGIGDINVNPSFVGTVEEIYDKYILVRANENQEIGGELEVSKKVVSSVPVPELKIGDKVKVVYNGEILESYPLVVAKVFAIYLA